MNGSKVGGGWAVNGDCRPRGAPNAPHEHWDEIAAASQLVVAKEANRTTWTMQSRSLER
jgi:hypothetical protein